MTKNTIGNRIEKIILEAGVKKIEFAKRIKVDPSYVSKIISDKEKKEPSDRLIDDICREFNINEVWLRTGEGEMRIDLSKEDEIASWMGEILRLENDDSFKSRFIHMLSKLDENDWSTLEKMTKLMLEENKN